MDVYQERKEARNETLLQKAAQGLDDIQGVNIDATVLPAMSDSDVMFCLQRYQGLLIDRPLVY